MHRHMCVVVALLLSVGVALAKTPTYNKMATVNMRDQGIPADERATNVLLASGNIVYGATSGD